MIVGHGGNAQHQLAIVEQQPRADFQRLEDFLVRQAYSRRVAVLRVPVEAEALAGDQLDLAVSKGADTQLRALQVGEDRRRAHKRLFEAADRGDHRCVVGLHSVAHVDAKGISPGADQLFDHLGCIARRTQRGEHTNLAGAGGERTVQIISPGAYP